MKRATLIKFIILSFSFICSAQNSQLKDLRFNDFFIEDGWMDRAGTLWFGSSSAGLQWINKGLSKCMYKNNPGQLCNFPGRSANHFAATYLISNKVITFKTRLHEN